MPLDSWLFKHSPHKMAKLCKIFKPRCPNSRPHYVRSGGPLGSQLYKGY